MFKLSVVRILIVAILSLSFGCSLSKEGPPVGETFHTEASAVVGDDDVVQVANGGTFTCALFGGGAVKCWGTGSFGELGTGTASTTLGQEAKTSGTAVLGGPAQKIVAGSEHVCALLENGTLRCWGAAEGGRLGYGNEEIIGDNETPADAGPVPVGGKVIDVSAGAYHTCAVRDDGDVYCWGASQVARGIVLGFPSTLVVGDDETPQLGGRIDLGGAAVAVTSGRTHACAIMDTGAVRCWGTGGGLGYVGVTAVEAPASFGDVAVGGAAVKLSAGNGMSCALLSNQAIRCWGDNSAGQLGLGHTDPIGDDETPQSAGFLALGGNAIDISTSEGHTCAVLDDSSLRCWGYSHFGALGYGNNDWVGDDELPFTAGAVLVGDSVAKVSTSNKNTCVVTATADVRCWGESSFGQLGHSITYDVGDNEPPNVLPIVPLGTSPDKVLSVHIGSNHACAALTSGALRCWGTNDFGKLGYGNVNDVGDNESIAAGGTLEFATAVVDATLGQEHSCAILANGNTHCWGEGSQGKLGYANQISIGASQRASTTSPVSLGDSVIDISSEVNHTCAVLANGEVVCWGRAGNGGLGYGNLQDVGDDEHPSDVGAVPLGMLASDVSVGNLHSCALSSAGSVKCWGDNYNGQLGYGHTDNIGNDETPDSVGLVSLGGVATEIVSGWQYNCALLSGGNVRCWGRGQQGELGYGNTNNIGDDETPDSAGDVPIGGTVQALASGTGHTCALLTNGKVRCWGANFSGQLGHDSSVYNRIGDDETPASVGDLPLPGTAVAIFAGGQTTCALMDDDRLICWGESLAPINPNPGYVSVFDSDADGVDDWEDTAPDNPLLCVDNDGDTCDECSSGDPANDGNDTDGDGLCDIGDPDIDNDGIANAVDNCPLDANPLQENSDGDAMADACDDDDDNDGVIDVADSAPLDPLVCQDSDRDGCEDCSKGNGFAPDNDGVDYDGNGQCLCGPDVKFSFTNTSLTVTEGDFGNISYSLLNPQSYVCDVDMYFEIAGTGNSPAIRADISFLGNTIDARRQSQGWYYGLRNAVDIRTTGSSSIRFEGLDDDAAEQSESVTITAVIPNENISVDPLANVFTVTIIDNDDDDSDGIANNADNCPTVANANQEDLDSDNVGDACDSLIDSDGDMVADAVDADPANPNVCGDSDGDYCDDCAVTGGPPAPGNDGPDADGNGICDAFNDDDGDGVPNAIDPSPSNRFGCGDSDNDGCNDCAVAGTSDPSNDGADFDGDGICDANADSDGDGLMDSLELAIGTSPADADSDDDGILDGAEGSTTADPDGDGLINAMDADSDDDGLLDGLERGLFGTPHADTDGFAGNYQADADAGATTTNPWLADSDGGGASDGAEDVNGNGKIDAGETNPNLLSDDGQVVEVDSDGDGLSDAQEIAIHTNPNDADTDDDGIIDGLEINYAVDHDHDGLINALDVDSDGDGIFDGTELGYTEEDIHEDTARGIFRPDADGGVTVSSMINADSDGGGTPDGWEDFNSNGAVDPGETSNQNGQDDTPQVDTDGDGLSDPQEGFIGSDPNDADSDNDGVVDGDEPNFNNDVDEDGVPSVLDADSDDDGLKDGTEAGITIPHADTNVSEGNFVADADPTTKTNPQLLDTDGGGVPDGFEDFNPNIPSLDLNGRVDNGEGDPNDPVDDNPTTADTDGDGLTNYVEGRGDRDNDGEENYVDIDSDGDSILDEDEAPNGELVNSDNGPSPDYLDGDADDDGLSDRIEAGDDDLSTTPRDTDGSGREDYRDTDSDDDGIPDWVEAPGQEVDTDGDGAPDNIDIDSDQDSISDAVEGGGAMPLDSDEDGVPDYLDEDSDNDGIPDSVEAGDSDVSSPPPDSDGDGVADFRDTDADDDNVLDAIDNCRTMENSDQSNEDGDLLGDLCDEDSSPPAGGCGCSSGSDSKVPVLPMVLFLFGLSRTRRNFSERFSRG